jgi:hypothetical protein
MPKTKATPRRSTALQSPVEPTGAVLTLAVVAAYLRVMEARTEELVRERNLPGRSLGDG